jgi:hypothetical protein
MCRDYPIEWRTWPGGLNLDRGRADEGDMGRLRVVLGLSVLALAGCGGGGAGAGEPLLSGALTGEYAGESFTPEFGFAALYHDKPVIALGAGPLNCASLTQAEPPADVNAVFQLPTFEVGSYSSVLVMIHYNRGHYEASGSNSGSVTLSAVTDQSVAGSVAYSYTDEDAKPHGLSGSFEVIRCP